MSPSRFASLYGSPRKGAEFGGVSGRASGERGPLGRRRTPVCCGPKCPSKTGRLIVAGLMQFLALTLTRNGRAAACERVLEIGRPRSAPSGSPGGN